MPLYARILFFLLCGVGLNARAQVIAAFTASPSSGCAPLVVSFTNNTTPATGNTYSWDLGNSSGIITLRDPSTSYLAAGTYTVTLTATHGGVSSIHSQVITVYPQPSVNFTVSDTALCPGAPFTFSSTSSAGMPGSLGYFWSFGDGYTATTSPSTHAYGLPGRFNVSLSVTNAGGCSNSLSKPSLIHIYNPPTPLFSSNIRHVCQHSGSVSFASSPVGTGPFTYRWDFGDGSAPSASAAPVHFYTAPGYYAVKLVVTDGHGCMDSLTQPAYISVTKLTPAFSGPDSSCVYATAAFSNVSGDALSALWLYGDGSSDTTWNGHHAFNTRGHYTVTLIAADSFCHDTFSHPLVVPSLPTVTISPVNPCPPPLTATLNVTVASGASVSWHFHDNSVATGNPITHFYAGADHLAIKDTIDIHTTSALGCKDTLVATYNVCNWDFDIRQPFGEPRGGCVPVTINISQNPGHAAYRCSSFKYAWDFGDGSRVDTMPRVSLPSGMPFTAHTFTATGVYPVKLIMVTDNGCIGAADYPIPVGNPAHATFTASPLRACYNNNLIAFTRTVVSGTPDSYYWLFGEGSNGYAVYDLDSQSVYTVYHHFSIPDTAFSDTLITYDRACPDTFIRHNYITIDSPKAKAVRTIVCSRPRTVFFQSISIGADSVRWLFGDGSASSGDTATHTYPLNAIYTCRAIAYNRRSGCLDTQLVYVDLTKPTVKITANDTTICKDGYVLMTASTTSGQVTQYKWLMTGNYPYNVTGDQVPVFPDTFHTAGIYTLNLVVFDVNGCTDTITKPNYIWVAHPTPHISVSPAGLCTPQTTVFTDTSTDLPGIYVVNHVWLFGDGSVAGTTRASISHNYPVAGNYIVTEYVTDNLGCFDSAKVNRSLYHPASVFTAPAHGCRGDAVPFTNWTTPATASYLWSFGDGYTSTALSPNHAFADTGRYNVRLIATDSHNCRDTSTHSIIVTKPRAAFSMSDSVGICPPFTVRFANSSARSSSYLWNLGNGTSVADSPVISYTPGFDTVVLVAIDSFGCRDTAGPRHVKVYGYSGAFTYNTDSGCAPLKVFFDAQLSNVSLASAITWDFGDGVTSIPSLSDTITYFYNHTGPWVPKLVINDHSGCVSSNIGKDTIKVDKVVPDFSAIPDPVCIHKPVLFADTSKSYWSHIVSTRWVINGSLSSTDSVSATFSTPGVYTVSMHAADGWGCTGDDTQTVSVYAPPPIVAMPDSIICVGHTISLSDPVAGGTWMSGATGIATVGSVSGIATGIAAGTAVISYTVDLCAITLTVTVMAHPDSGIITGDSAVCVGASTTLMESTPNGAWSVANANATISVSGTVTGLVAGIDTVIYSVANAACTAQATKPIVIFPLPDPGTISGKDTICKSAMTELTESNTHGYWVSGDSAIASIDSAGLVRGISMGLTVITYMVGPDSNGCANTAVFPLAVINTDMVIDPTVTNVDCYLGSNGRISVGKVTGTPPFSFAWSTGDTASHIDSLLPGNYSVTISEPAKNCTLTQSFTISSPDSLYVTAEVINDVCERQNGSIKLAPHGGTAPYRFMWSNKSVAAEIEGVPRGSYSSLITDANGCTAQYAIILIDSTCPDIIIHDGMSPNGDGINDAWVIEGLWRYPNNVVKIFDKWGDELFEASNYKSDWNGTGSKGAVADGTYYYLVKLNAEYPPHGRDEYTGALLIKR